MDAGWVTVGGWTLIGTIVGGTLYAWLSMELREYRANREYKAWVARQDVERARVKFEVEHISSDTAVNRVLDEMEVGRRG